MPTRARTSSGEASVDSPLHTVATFPARAAAAPDAPLPRRRGAFLRQFRSEMRLQLTRRRNLILLALLAGVPIFNGVAVKVSNPWQSRHVP